MRSIFSFWFLTISIFSINLVSAQEDVTFDLDFEVNRVYPGLSISTDQLDKAVTLIDLNSYYKPNWVESYISVEITAFENGKARKELSKDNVITKAQKELMQSADIGSNIEVLVNYIPKNNLKDKEQKIENFSFKIDPKQEASYGKGKEDLLQYLSQNTLEEIDESTFEPYKLTAVKFSINENGEVVDAQVVEKSPSAAVDKLILDAICNMPNWEPAAYSDGTKVSQDFVFTIGDHSSCVINLLNIRRS